MYRTQMYGGREASAWNDFRKAHKGQKKTMTELAALYRQTAAYTSGQTRHSPAGRTHCAGQSMDVCSTKENCKWYKGATTKAGKRKSYTRKAHCQGIRFTGPRQRATAEIAGGYYY